MYPVLILREEVVCLLVLSFLAIVSRSYRMGADGKLFHRLLTYAFTHVSMDIVTVLMVNHTESVPYIINYICHLIFYLSAILFSYEILMYVIHLYYPHFSKRDQWLCMAPIGLYLVAIPLLKIEFVQLNGTWASVGTAAYIGYALAFGYMMTALILMARNWKQMSRHFRYTLPPIVLVAILAEIVQIIVREFLFTGGAVTIVTVGFFFTLENPTLVLERKGMVDAMLGVGDRNSYEKDMKEYDRCFAEDPTVPFTFLFIDINNLRSINGIYGHEAGDKYIGFIAMTLMKNLKSAEKIYRMGGDEFLAVYRNVDEKTVVRDITQVREECSRRSEEMKFKPTLATGYAVSSEKYRSLHDVLRVADYMMYRNKTEQKREVAMEVSHGVSGTNLNLTGLTDRVFDAMCLSSVRYYPFLTNLETGVTRIAPAMNEFFDLGGEFLADFETLWVERVHQDDREAFRDDITDTLIGKKQYHFCNYRAKDKNGEYVEITCQGGVYHGKNGEPDIFAGYLLNHGTPETMDPTTGLKNSRALYDTIDEAIREQTEVVILRMEVNNMSRIRMLYGNDTAAIVTRELADTFLRESRGIGRVYSSEGVNFAMYLPGLSAEETEELYRRLRAMCLNGIKAQDVMIPVGISGGALQLPSPTIQSKDAARSALLFAVEESRFSQHNNLTFFSRGQNRMTTEDMSLLMTIHRDCVGDRKHFLLRYQPIIQVSDGRVVGAEALLRWMNGEEEVSPTRFINFLENDPSYNALGYDILEVAIRRAKKIREKLPDFRMSVNITALQLYEEDFIEKVTKYLEKEAVPAEALVLELTERCKEMDFDFLKQRVTQLREKGIRIALDDMGTGFSTINLLLHLPVDEVKLDHAFTRELRSDPKNELYTSVLCQAAASGQAEVCFEGVENQEILDYLKSYGSVLAQGFYFDKPLRHEEFEAKYCQAEMITEEKVLEH